VKPKPSPLERAARNLVERAHDKAESNGALYGDGLFEILEAEIVRFALKAQREGYRRGIAEAASLMVDPYDDGLVISMPNARSLILSLLKSKRGKKS
jgi:hypothetical protein